MARILAVCGVAAAGGAELGLLRLLRRLDWDVLLTSPGPGALADAGFPWAPLKLGSIAAGGGRRAVLSWPRARRLARGRDVVYLNGGVAGRLLPALGSARTVLHIHDLVDRVPRFWASANVVLADSAAVAARLPGLDAQIVYCPVDLDPPATAPPWPSGPGPVVAAVGRIEPRKGVLDLVLAAPAIRAAVPNARIVIVGDDPYRTDPGYVEAVRGATDVEHCGWVDEAAGLMRHIDVLVVPSRAEPFGTVAAEALAVGTPVVATRVGGLPEVVTDGVTGRLVPPGDVPALAAAVIDVLTRRDAMSAAGPAAARRFDVNSYTRRVAGLIAP